MEHPLRQVHRLPPFKGFGQYILLLDSGRYDKDTPLQNVASLLSYHSNNEVV